MKKLLTILFLLLLSGCALPNPPFGGGTTIADSLKLKTTKDKIVYNETLKDEKGTDVVEYYFISDDRLNNKEDYYFAENKNFSGGKYLERGPHTIIEFNVNKVYQDDKGDIYGIGIATTTKEEYDKQTKVSFFEKIFGRKVNATTDTYLSNDTWTAPTGVTKVNVRAWGGGGAGGGVVTDACNGCYYSGGGGAGGQFTADFDLTVTPGNGYAIVVAATTTGSTGNGGWGATSTFDTTTVVAGGGQGGKSYENGGTDGAGSITGGVGDVVFAGGSGNDNGGGGAGSTGTGFIENSGTSPNPGTNSRQIGGGAGGGGHPISTSSGHYGLVAGGGGGSAGCTNSTSNTSGGSGAPGKLTIEYCTTGSCTLNYDSPVISTWTAPTGVTSVEVACWGAGGSGWWNTANQGGGGGGGGAFASSTGISVTAGNSYTVVIASTTSTAGAFATSTSFNYTIVKAASGHTGNGMTAGIGGPTASSTGTVTYKGGNGGAGETSGDTSGGGGGAGGPHGAGNNGTAGNGTVGGAGGSGDAGSGGTAGASGSSAKGGAGNHSILGGGGGGGGDDSYNGGPGGYYGGGGGGGENTSYTDYFEIGFPGACQIIYTVPAAEGGSTVSNPYIPALPTD